MGQPWSIGSGLMRVLELRPWVPLEALGRWGQTRRQRQRTRQGLLRSGSRPFPGGLFRGSEASGGRTGVALVLESARGAVVVWVPAEGPAQIEQTALFVAVEGSLRLDRSELKEPEAE